MGCFAPVTVEQRGRNRNLSVKKLYIGRVTDKKDDKISLRYLDSDVTKKGNTFFTFPVNDDNDNGVPIEDCFPLSSVKNCQDTASRRIGFLFDKNELLKAHEYYLP